ncbi:MAG: hypothetical protein PHQ12_04645 [Chthoniobacteraceae bacterium]|nr:hypothetical protein [Chthoniobacteraceae bacterium]
MTLAAIEKLEAELRELRAKVEAELKSQTSEKAPRKIAQSVWQLTIGVRIHGVLDRLDDARDGLTTSGYREVLSGVAKHALDRFNGTF